MTEEEIKKYTNRIYRNKTKILHHKIYICMAIALLLILTLFQPEIVNKYLFYVVTVFIALVLSDVIAIFYHKWWIKNWRKKLTEGTGRDYMKLDSLEEEYIKEEDFKKFCEKYLKDEDYILLSNPNSNFATKIYMASLNLTLKAYCERYGILNTYKIKDLPYLEKFCKKMVDKK